MTLAMSWREWAQHDGVALAARVRKGELTPAELAAQAAAGIQKTNGALSAVVEVFEDVVRDPLKDGMNPQGPFAGVPYLMKDLGPTLKGRLQEMGSALMQGNRAVADSFLTRQIRKAGLNILGRTTTPEFGVCSSAENPAVYVTRNPWDLSTSPGGSSSGAAVCAAGAAAAGAARLPARRGADGNRPRSGDRWPALLHGCLERALAPRVPAGQGADVHQPADRQKEPPPRAPEHRGLGHPGHG